MAAKTAGTWASISRPGYGAFTDVDTTARFPLGTRVEVKDTGATAYPGDAELIYLPGCASTARGSVVTISGAVGTYTSALIAARAIGDVAVALAAVTAATSFGWYQTRGVGVALCDAGVADGAALYIDGTSGRCDDTAVAGDAIQGMRAASADDTNTCLVVMNYPKVGDFDNA